MRKSQYEATDKFDLTINGWGGEDVKFFEACLNARVKQSQVDVLFIPVRLDECSPQF